MFNKLNRFHQKNKLSKFCKEAGFIRVVEVGQCFVTRDAGEFKQTVACREYTLPRDDKASQPKGWIRGNMRIGLVLEVTTSFQHFRYGIEIRIESVNQDNSYSWVKISYGTVKYVNDSLEDDTKSCRFTRRGTCTNKLRCGCSQVEGKSKTSTEGIYWHLLCPVNYEELVGVMDPTKFEQNLRILEANESTRCVSPLHMSTADKSERAEQNQDLRCQSGPSAKDSVIFSG